MHSTRVRTASLQRFDPLTPFAGRFGSPIGRLLLALMIGVSVMLGAAAPTRAADVTLEATAMLGGHVRPGAWAAVVVRVRNSGPAIEGELRVRSSQQGVSRFGVAVHLAPDAEQEHILYVQPPLFGSRLSVEMVSGETQVAAIDVPIKSHDTYSPIIVVVAERPEGFSRDVGQAVANPNIPSNPSVISLRASDLPPRVEAWSAIDRLVWQDVDFGTLSDDQLNALRVWVGAGGRLVIVGGTTGVGTLDDLPPDMLPFVPERTVDVSTSDLAALLGTLPAGATSVPAVAGTLQRGTFLARSGDVVYAAQQTYGQGAVTIIGVNPATSWLAGSESAEALWRRALPLTGGTFVNPFIVTDDYIFQSALYNLPAVALPPIEQLFVLLLAYIALIGPVNYLVLRRLDKREWAWVTMPLLVLVFAVGSYGLGAALKGSDVIVNQVAIVRAGEGTDSGISQVYVGVFSPTRRSFDVRIPNGALISTPVSQAGSGTTEQPIDALIGDNVARLRNFEVGFGVMRGFRADTATSAPRITADLTLAEGRVTGTVTNHSSVALENVAIIFGGGVHVVDRLEPAASAEVDIRQQGTAFGFSIADRIFGMSFSNDVETQRRIMTRRVVIEQITGYGSRVQGTLPEVPVLVGWQSAPSIEVLLAGEEPNRVGDSLYVVPLGLTYASNAVFDNALIAKSIVETQADQAWLEAESFTLGRGTMVVEARPAGMTGLFRPTELEIALSTGGPVAMRGNGRPIAPLPDSEQPDQEDPAGDPSGGNGGQPGGGGQPGSEPGKPMPEPGMEWQPLPALQLYDHAAGRWYEFEPFEDMRTYTIQDVARWVDSSGRVLVRLVNRGNAGEQQWFQLSMRMKGTIE
jgi:hypothetical protein